MQYNAKFRFLFYILILCSVFILPLSSSDVRAGETVINDSTTTYTWTTDEFHVSGTDVTLNGTLGSTADINACDDPGVTCSNFSGGSGFNVAFACAGNSVASSTGGWQDITTGTGGQCWSTLDVCYYFGTINEVCDNPPGDFGQPNMKIVSAIDDCSTVPTANKKTGPSGKKYCSINYTGSGTIVGNTGDDMFKIQPDAKAFMLYKRPVDAGAPDADLMELNFIERITGAGAQPTKDMMLPSGPFTDYKDYKNFVTNPPTGVVNVTPACTPTSITLCSGPDAFELPAVNGQCGTANATYVDNKFGKKWWSYGGIPNNEDEATSASPTKCVKGWDTPVTLASSPPVYNWSCDGAANGSGSIAGTTANCSVMKIVNGSCGSANGNDYYTAPASGMWCGDARSNPPSLDISATGWTWKCQGIPNNTLATEASCSANRNIDGVCGSADGTSFYLKPTSGLCSAGTKTAITGTGTTADPWVWDCTGAFSGTTASCSALQKIDGACGPSDNSSSASAPTTGLCTQPAGATPPVTASGGSYNWTCPGVNGGINDACSTAPPPSCDPAPTGSDTNGTCGTAHGSTYADLATLNAASANHCLTGSATSPTQSGTNFAWSCIGTGVGTTQNCSASEPAVNGTCGTANGTNRTSAPSGAGLCATGVATSVSGSGPWTWGCDGTGGGTSTAANACQANKKINAACGSANGTTRSSAPSGSILCASGNATSVSGSGPWTWGCNGINGGTSTGASACSAAKTVTAVNGSCGSANGTNRTSAPSGSALCSSGSATSVSGTGPWTWGCNGSGGGSSTSATACSANKKINGSCGSANGTTRSSAPSGGILCSSGGATSVTDNGTNWTWGCNGSNGGTSTGASACSATNSTPTCNIYTKVIGPVCAAVPTSPYLDVATCMDANYPSLGWCSFGMISTTGDKTGASEPVGFQCKTEKNNPTGYNTGHIFEVVCSPSTPQNGVCGSADGTASATAPSSGLCSTTGSTPSVTDSGLAWTWTCTGTSGGTDDSCTAPKSGGSMCGIPTSAPLGTTYGGMSPFAILAGCSNGYSSTDFSYNGMGGSDTRQIRYDGSSSYTICHDNISISTQMCSGGTPGVLAHMSNPACSGSVTACSPDSGGSGTWTQTGIQTCGFQVPALEYPGHCQSRMGFAIGGPCNPAIEVPDGPCSVGEYAGDGKPFGSCGSSQAFQRNYECVP